MKQEVARTTDRRSVCIFRQRRQRNGVVAAHSKRRRRVAGRVAVSVIVLVLLYAIGFVWYWNQRAIWMQEEAPFDHIAAVLQKPFLALTCLVIPDNDDDAAADNTPLGETTTPPIVMISARPPEKVRPVYESWSNGLKQLNATVRLVSTYNISMEYRNLRCRRYTFASLLFAVYQHVFSELLLKYQKLQYFVIVEDDVILLNATRFHRELRWAMKHNLGFYSFNPPVPASSAAALLLPSSSKSSSSSSSCVYEYGTTAQLISRTLMLQVLNADTDSFCRLPIDMFIARAGPWYVTVHPITKHIGSRLRLANENDTAAAAVTSPPK